MTNADRYRIEVKPVSHFMLDQSSPDDDRYVFVYTITKMCIRDSVST